MIRHPTAPGEPTIEQCHHSVVADLTEILVELPHCTEVGRHLQAGHLIGQVFQAPQDVRRCSPQGCDETTGTLAAQPLYREMDPSDQA